MKQGTSRRTPWLLAPALGLALAMPSAHAQPSRAVDPSLLQPPQVTSPSPTVVPGATPAVARAATPASAPRRVTTPRAPQTTVIEDDATRIEETRVDGRTDRVVVKSKRVDLPAWEIRPTPPGRSGAVDARLPNDSANPRVWSVFSF